MTSRHPSSFAPAQLGEHGADVDVVDQGGVEVRDGGESGAEDVREEFVVVGGVEGAAVGAGDGGAEGGEEDDVGGMFLEDVFGAFLDEGRHDCGAARLVDIEVFLEANGELSSLCLLRDGLVHGCSISRRKKENRREERRRRPTKMRKLTTSPTVRVIFRVGINRCCCGCSGARNDDLTGGVSGAAFGCCTKNRPGFFFTRRTTSPPAKGSVVKMSLN